MGFLFCETAAVLLGMIHNIKILTAVTTNNQKIKNNPFPKAPENIEKINILVEIMTGE